MSRRIYLSYAAVPCALLFIQLFFPDLELSLEHRLLCHALAFTLCYIPLHLGRYLGARKPSLATGAYLSANPLRLGGFLIVLLLFRDAGPTYLRAAIVIYITSVFAFLIFQFILLFWEKRQRRLAQTGVHK